MTRIQKTLTISLWGLLAVIVALVVLLPPRGGQQQPVLPVLYDAPAFELIDQNERSVTEQTLRGHAWVGAFIFTRCAGPCPMMTQKMAELQQAVPDADVRLVSFSLDPDYDTPAVLREYAEAFGADQSRWHFLTGDRQHILDVAAGMKITAMVGVEQEEDIVHADYFVLVDPQGKIRGYYRGIDDEALAQLASDIERL